VRLRVDRRTFTRRLRAAARPAAGFHCSAVESARLPWRRPTPCCPPWARARTLPGAPHRNLRRPRLTAGPDAPWQRRATYIVRDLLRTAVSAAPPGRAAS
jgi:hypothetical protein